MENSTLFKEGLLNIIELTDNILRVVCYELCPPKHFFAMGIVVWSLRCRIGYIQIIYVLEWVACLSGRDRQCVKEKVL